MGDSVIGSLVISKLNHPMAQLPNKKNVGSWTNANAYVFFPAHPDKRFGQRLGRKAKKSRRHQTGCAAAATSGYRRQQLVSRRTTPLITHSDFAENGEDHSLIHHVDRLLDRSAGTAGKAVTFAFVAVKNNLNAVVHYVRLIPKMNQPAAKRITGSLFLSNCFPLKMQLCALLYLATNGK